MYCDGGGDANDNPQTNPGTKLAQASYTLHMWDDRAGFMSPNTALSFAMYTPQAPQACTPLSSGESACSILLYCTVLDSALCGAAWHGEDAAALPTGGG
jgi:hypothetical protein